jgi:hypothetical protein
LTLVAGGDPPGGSKSSYRSPGGRNDSRSLLKYYGISACERVHPHRGCVPEPRVARHELPWVTVQKISTPQGLRLPSSLCVILSVINLHLASQPKTAGLSSSNVAQVPKGPIVIFRSLHRTLPLIQIIYQPVSIGWMNVIRPEWKSAKARTLIAKLASLVSTTSPRRLSHKPLLFSSVSIG